MLGWNRLKTTGVVVQLFLALVRKSERRIGQADRLLPEKELDRIVCAALAKYFPVIDFDRECSTESWWSPERRSAIWLASNEGASEPVLTGEREAGLVLSSFGISLDTITGSYGFSESALRRAPGAFLGIRADDAGIDVVTDAAALYPVFWAEAGAHWLVSNRLALVEHVREALTGKPRSWDLASLRHYGNQSHYFGRDTCFEDVKAMGVHELLRLTGEGVSTRTWFQTESALQPGDRDYAEILAQLADALVDACRPMVASGVCNLPISGGRDSRLIAAAASHWTETTFSASTSGMPDHPDVVIARIIAERFGWPHTFTPPSPVPTLIKAEDPVAKAKTVLDQFDLTSSAWDNVVPYRQFVNRVSASGVGGEIMRGGYAATYPVAPTVERAAGVINTIMVREGSVFDPSGDAIVRERARPWLAMAESDPFLVLDRLYHQDRNRRWVAARRNGERLRAHVADPLLDNRVVLSMLRIAPAIRWTERMFFDVLLQLAPQLVDVPIEGSRWRFESEGPAADMPSHVRDTWAARFSMKVELAQRRHEAKWLMHPGYRSEVFEAIRERALAAPDGLINFDKLNGLLRDEAPRWPTIMWHLLTMLVLVVDGIEDHRRLPIPTKEYECPEV